MDDSGQKGRGASVGLIASLLQLMPSAISPNAHWPLWWRIPARRQIQVEN